MRGGSQRDDRVVPQGAALVRGGDALKRSGGEAGDEAGGQAAEDACFRGHRGQSADEAGTFIPQAAIPFALRDPLRVIPATAAGGALTGFLTMDFGVTMAVPYGGFFVGGQLGKPLMVIVAFAAGTLVTAALTMGLKSLRRTAPATAPKRTVGARQAVPASS